MIEGIATLIAAGNYAETACRTMGITPKTYANWLQQGAEDEAAGRETIHRAFLQAINRADAQAEVNLVELARTKSTADHTAIGAFTFLDRRWRERWGQTQQLNITETKSVTITHVEVCLPPGSPVQAIEGQVVELTETPQLPAPTDNTVNTTTPEDVNRI
jgi:hypothetical protein